MSTILWLVSFTLHGILIYFVIILNTRLSAFKAAE
ncbi:Swarming motility protein SwrB, partial [Salmonella enterica subsp. enterica serovar Derby]|nr:Swarming motility protein SwrB [Salmonella enterica subsp. enterica serovar Derby]